MKFFINSHFIYILLRRSHRLQLLNISKGFELPLTQFYKKYNKLVINEASTVSSYLE